MAMGMQTNRMNDGSSFDWTDNELLKEVGNEMTTNLSMRELTEKDLKEAVEMYIAVFSAETMEWSTDRSSNYRICVIHDGDEYLYWLFSNGLIGPMKR